MANFIFHKTLAPKVVNDFDYEKYISSGEWASSPDFFKVPSNSAEFVSSLPPKEVLDGLDESVNCLKEALTELKSNSSVKKPRGRPKRIIANEPSTENNK
jgi:hypothetical protein